MGATENIDSTSAQPRARTEDVALTLLLCSCACRARARGSSAHHGNANMEQPTRKNEHCRPVSVWTGLSCACGGLVSSDRTSGAPCMSIENCHNTGHIIRS